MKVYIFVSILSFLLKLSSSELSPLISTLVHPKDRQNIHTRIIGGKEAGRHEYPYQVALIISIKSSQSQYFCAGTLISEVLVLTAAHCLDRANKVEVILGAHNISATEPSQVRQISYNFIIHKDYDENKFLNDIALIKLPRKVTFNDCIQPAKHVGMTAETFANTQGVAIGWGRTESGALSKVLKFVDVDIMSNEKCVLDDAFKPYVVDSHICTSGLRFVGSCSGDSGGPLIHDGVQIGIVSYGPSVCTLGKPSAYTRLSMFSDWLQNPVGRDSGNSAAEVSGNAMVAVSFAAFVLCSY